MNAECQRLDEFQGSIGDAIDGVFDDGDTDND